MKSRTLSITVICDECGEDYHPELVAVPTIMGGEYQSFTCPKCDTEYPVCTITKRGLALRDEIQRLRQSVKAADHLEKYLEKALQQFERECRKHERPT